MDSISKRHLICWPPAVLGLVALSWLASNAVAVAQNQRNVGPVVDRADASGGYYALIIGEAAYKYLGTLRTPVDDAQDLGRLLREQLGFHTELLLNAGHDQILAALAAYQQRLDSNSNLLIYYAGHGIYQGEGFWLPTDATLLSNREWISADMIKSDLRRISSRHVLIVSDSCFSGTMRGPTPPVTNEERNRYLERVMAGTSRTLISSGGNEPVADGGSSGHSIFAAKLLAALARIDYPEFSAQELFNYIQEQVAGNSDQVPQYGYITNSGHDAGDFVFLRTGPRARPAPPPTKAPNKTPYTGQFPTGLSTGGGVIKDGPCVNPPISPVFNPYPIWFTDPGLKCVDFPMLRLRTDTTPFPANDQELKAGVTAGENDEISVLLYIHNGAVENLPGFITTARNVVVHISVDNSSGPEHRITARYTADNASSVEATLPIHTGAGQKLLVVPASGQTFDYKGEALKTGLSIGSKDFLLGNLKACFGHSMFLYFKIRVVADR